VTTYKLHEHQEKAVAYLHEHPRAGLLLPMAAGKTLSVLAALGPEHLPVLVVAPKQVAEHVWPQETARWRPDLTLAAAIGTPAKRAEAIKAKADITVVSRDNLQSIVSTRGKAKYKTVVLDELQSFKSKGSTRWKLARKLSRHVQYCWGLTGTPAGNGLLDIWAQIFLLDSGERLYDTLDGYRERYFYSKGRLPNGVPIGWKLKPGAEDAIHRKLSDLCLHIPLTKLDLPEITYNRVPTELPASARALYEELKTEMTVDLDLMGGEVTADSAGVLSAKLAQVTAGSIYDDDRHTVHLHNAKLDQLAEIIEQTEGGVLVFYRFRHEAERILKRFKQATSVKATGAIDAWNRGEIPVMLAHPASAGHGLNLQHGGSVCVWTSVSFSLDDWQQGNARLRRPGQKNPVVIHTLTTPDTIDEHVLAVLEGKKTVQQALLDALR
jgi:SNF2 family DNA or RNA helicase